MLATPRRLFRPGWILLNLRNKSDKASESSKKTIKIKRRGEFLFGVSPCLAALQANRRRVHAVFLKRAMKKKDWNKTAVEEIRKTAKERKIELHWIDKPALEKLSGNRPHQGVVLDVDPLKFKALDRQSLNKYFTSSKEKLKSREQKDINAPPPPVWIALDEIQDPMNFGAILRCALFFGVERVVVAGKNCCPLTPVVSKASAGAMELLPVNSVRQLATCLQEARICGWNVVGTCAPPSATSSSANDYSNNENDEDEDNEDDYDDEEEDYNEDDEDDDDDDDEEEDYNEDEAGDDVVYDGDEADKAAANSDSSDAHRRPSLGKPKRIPAKQYVLRKPTILVLGNEGSGLRKGIVNSCSFLLSIPPGSSKPLPVGFDSLNVSVATGVLLHSLMNE